MSDPTQAIATDAQLIYPFAGLRPVPECAGAVAFRSTKSEKFCIS